MSLHPLEVGTKIYAVDNHNKIISFEVSEVKELKTTEERMALLEDDVKMYKYDTVCNSK